MGVKLVEEHIPTLLFADDQVVVVEDEENGNCMVRKLIETYEEWRLISILQKTQYLVVVNYLKTDIKIQKDIIKNTSE